MACGIPVVATRVGGVPEVVRDGVTGILAEADDLAGYADALRQLLDDAPRARAMGEAAREEVERRWTRDGVVSRYEMLYRRVLERRASARAAGV